jgi:hypothetical protein
MARTRSVILAVAPTLALVACSSLLGDYTVSPGGLEDAGGPGTGTEASSEAGNVGPDGGGGADGEGGVPILPRLGNAVSVAAGRTHTCAITAAQDVLCWGSNGAGQLGVPIAQVARTSFPVMVDLGGKATAIAAGGAHTCAILTDGKIKCWGGNERGQLGRGTLVPTGSVDLVSPPTKNVGLWTTAEVITAGASFTCAGMNEGSANGLPDRRFFCWGENIDRESGTESTNGQPALLPSLITQSGNDSPSPGLDGFTISSGDNFACAGYYGAAGAAVFSIAGCWGSRAVGQLGSPAVAGFEVSPGKYPSTKADGTASPLFGLFKVGLLATGASHGCARFEQSGVSPVALDCWGDNAHGQTGSPMSGARPAEAIAGFDATSVTALAAGGQNTCVIVNGQVQCIGANDVGQLGRGTVDVAANPVFANTKLPPSASAISVGATHACAVLGAAPGQKGPVACWGQNQNGQLGDGFDIDVGYPGEPDALKRIRATPVGVAAPK